MKGFVVLSMILDVVDAEALEDIRSNMESVGWEKLVESAREAGEERGRADEVDALLDEAVLFYGVQAWPLPYRPAS